MDTLRKPFFFVALGLILLVVLVELGSVPVLGWVSENITRVRSTTTGILPPGQGGGDSQVSSTLTKLDSDQRAQFDNLASVRPPGLGIPYMALLDAVVLFTIGLMGLGLLIPERIQGRGQGCLTFIFGLLLILGAIILIFIALALVLLMVSLLLAVPFGTIAYLALFGSFDKGGAAAVLSLIMAIKLGFVVCLFLAQQKFLQNKGLVLLVLTSLLANIILSFLHGLVPSFLVSITDGIGALLMGILAVIWALVLLIGSLFGIVKAIQLKV
ncbi:MAG: hypothetical protein J0I20_13450 [Chloroflexi bacterium]|nr:hypothetical protein [Chloroflexota bacterium]OJV92848.1 MAG: hypothetical protein BGO39_30300 [Chloroflexi bacterium 54-19]